MKALDYTQLFDPEPAHLAIYETDGQFTVINIAEANYPRMILPTERHLAAAWALAFKAENPATVLDRASFTAAPASDSRRVPTNVLQFRRRPLEPIDEEVGRA